MKRKMISTVLGLLVGGLGAVSAWAQDAVRFGTDWLAQGAHGGFYQALADGTYEKYGLDVEILPGGPQVNNRPALSVGKLDFLMSGNLLLPFDSVVNGIPTKVVAAFFQKDPQILMTHDGQYASWEDLPSAEKILIGKDAQFSFWRWLVTEHGFKNESLRPYNYSLAEFLSDPKVVQQGYLVAEPVYAESEGIKPGVFLLADYGWNTYSTMIETRVDLIEDKPDMVQRFLDASAIGWYNFLYNDPSAGIAAIVEANPELSSDAVMKERALIVEYALATDGDAATKGIGAITPERVQSFYDMALRTGILEDDNIELDKVADFTFMNKGVGLDLAK